MLPEKHPILFRLAKFAFRLTRPVLIRLRKVYVAYKRIMPDHIYHAWAHAHKTSCFVEGKITTGPLISIVVPVYNTPHRHLLEMVYSVTNQHYQNWELILVNASDNPLCQQQTKDCEAIDTKITVVDLPKNEGISGNTNAGLAKAQGEYVAFLDHDDLLHPCALHSMVEAMQGKSRPGLLYSDEDKISDSSSRYFNPHCKPAWSPDLLNNVNYINHLTLIRRELVEAVGGLRPTCDGAQDYDLLLRVIDQTHPVITHVPRVLYHWRAAERSTARDISTKQYIFKAGVQALKDHLKRSNIHARVEHLEGKPGFYEVAYQPTEFSIVIGPVAAAKRHAAALWVEELLKTVEDKASIELVVGEWYKEFAMEGESKVSTVLVPKSAHYWREALQLATKPISVCFKAAALPTTPNGLAKLAASAKDVHHSALTPTLLNDDLTIMDGGVVGDAHLPKKLFEGYKFGQNTYFGNTDWVRNVADLTTHVVAAPTEQFQQWFAKRDYQNVLTLRAIAGASNSEPHTFVVWAHTPFNYKGLLRPQETTDYHSEVFRTKPATAVLSNDWGRGHERANG